MLLVHIEIVSTAYVFSINEFSTISIFYKFSTTSIVFSEIEHVEQVSCYLSCTWITVTI